MDNISGAISSAWYYRAFTLTQQNKTALENKNDLKTWLRLEVFSLGMIWNLIQRVAKQFHSSPSRLKGSLWAGEVSVLVLFGILSIHAKKSTSILSRPGLKVCGGLCFGGVWWWLRPFLVFAFSHSHFYISSVKLDFDALKR